MNISGMAKDPTLEVSKDYLRLPTQKFFSVVRVMNGHTSVHEENLLALLAKAKEDRAKYEKKLAERAAKSKPREVVTEWEVLAKELQGRIKELEEDNEAARRRSAKLKRRLSSTNSSSDFTENC